MDSVALWLEDSDKESDAIAERVQQKIIRDTSVIMSLANSTFVKNFRLNKNLFMYIYNLIKGDLKSPERSEVIAPLQKLAATLKSLALVGYQHQIGQDRLVGLSHPSISICLSEVCEIIEPNLCPKHVIFEMT